MAKAHAAQFAVRLRGLSPQSHLLREDVGVGVVRLTLNRPEKRNALSFELRDALADALEGDAGAFVITGAGSAFCAGMDVTQFGGDAANRARIVETSTRLFRALAFCPVPVVAFVNGPALAGGFALALFCDMRIAAPEATFGFVEVARGIPASYAAARAALPEGIARDLCLSGRVIDAAEAQQLGVARAGSIDDALGAARAAATPTGRAIKARALLEPAWLPLLEEEERALRAAVADR
jgi:enoyl-CoA hydratase/carnithine racemase